MNNIERSGIIRQAWEDRDGRPVTDGNEAYTFIYGIVEPPICIDEPIDMFLDGLGSVDPNFAYNWSERWGNTRISKNVRQSNEAFFVEYGTSESNKYDAISSKLKKPASSFFNNSNSHFENPLLLLLNNEETTLEGALLQIERMLDEVVWRKSQKIIRDNPSTDNQTAFSNALEFIRTSGVDIRYTSEDSILKLKQKDSSIPVRIYGNIFRHNTIPEVIGAIVSSKEDFCNYGKPPSRDILLNEEKLNLDLNENDIAIKGIMTAVTVAKRPHLGHLLLEASAMNVYNTVDADLKIIEANDIGPRIVGTVRAISESTSLPIDEIVSNINTSKISNIELESYYRKRSNIESFYSYESIIDQLHLDKQAMNWAKTLQSSDEFDDKLSQIILDSRTDKKLHQLIINELSPKWNGFGYALTNHKNSTIVLEKNGQPTSTEARIAAIIRAIGSFSLSQLYIVDHSKDVKKAAEIVSSKIYKDFPITVVSGAALGYDSEIVSGSKGNSMALEDIRWDGSISLKAACQFLISSTYQFSPDGRDPFYNFKDQNAFIDSINKSSKKYIEIKESLNNNSLHDYLSLEITDSIEYSTNQNIIKWKLMNILRNEPQALFVMKNGGSYLKFEEVSGKKLLKLAGLLNKETQHKGQQRFFYAGQKMIQNNDKAFYYSDLNQYLESSGYHTDELKFDILNKAIENRVSLNKCITPLSSTINMIDLLKYHVVSVDKNNLDKIYNIIRFVFNKFME